MRADHELPAFVFVLPWSLSHIGGVNQVVINLAQRMLVSGKIYPIIIVNDWSAKNPLVEMVDGLRVVRWQLRIFHKNMGLKKRVAYWLWEKKFNRQFELFCRQHKVVALNPHFVDSVAFTLARVVARFKVAPRFLLSLHGADVTSILSDSPEALCRWRKLLIGADRVVVCSNALGSKVAEGFGGLVTTTIHNGIDISSFVGSPDASAINVAKRIILTVGKFEGKKGQDVLIKVFAKLAKCYSDIELVLVGATGQALPSLHNLCDELGINDRVLFFSDVPHSSVEKFFRQASIFVLPSREEPFGIVLLEAGAFKLPVIATRVGGIPEILSDGKTGLLIEPDDMDMLENKLKILLDDPMAGTELGANLYKTVLTKFSWATACIAYTDLANLQGRRWGGNAEV